MIKEACDPTTTVNENLKQMQDRFKNWKNINLNIIVSQK